MFPPRPGCEYKGKGRGRNNETVVSKGGDSLPLGLAFNWLSGQTKTPERKRRVKKGDKKENFWFREVATSQSRDYGIPETANTKFST